MPANSNSIFLLYNAAFKGGVNSRVAFNRLNAVKEGISAQVLIKSNIFSLL